jgi:SNF2 family DNA or RNA helicase
VNEMMEDEWFFDAFEKLNDRGIEVLGLNELEHFKYNPYKAKIQTSISSGQDWFDVHIDVKFGDLTVSLNEVKRAVLKQNRYVKLSDGSMGILPSEWLKRFSKMFRHGDVKGQDLKISSQKFLIIEELFDNIDNEEVHKALLEKKRKLKSFKSISKVKVPQTIRAELRHYQKEGVNWLNFLHQFGWGGILADDMGLGKTLQILTFLSIRKSKTPSLIVVPTTLMFNWENEIEKFCPSLPAYFHYGPNRGQNKKVFKGNDVIITTYGMVANDIEWLKEITFNYVIIDESQAIKNPQSLRFKSVCLLKAKNKIAMTGTPIENNTFDLYAQMHFVNPGLLGNMKSFKDQFSQPIDRDGNGQVAGELRKMISPFLIRRTKEQVAKELPPKTEDVLFCTMEKEQRQVYDAFRNKYRNMLMGKIEEDGLEKSKIYVIEGLMKLRQICDSPELLSGDEDYGSVSIKVEELLRNIEEKTGKHKIVVFSQFVSMLKIIQKALDHDGVLYEYLDGKSTKKARKQSVERFQEDENCRVFLISLKAGGTGLNLTAADYVFLVDPWWNPAVEEQAIDRTYRIGQDKKVFAYRMICKDTIEEKILNYQEKKKAIAADIIQAEESFVKKLSFEDIKDLFS